MRPYKISFYLSLIFLICSLGTVSAVEPLSGIEIHRLCKNYKEDPNNENSLACRYYIQGFLGGGHATGKKVDKYIELENKQRSKFVERATYTRVHRKINRYGHYELASYCIDKTETIGQVTHKITDYLNTGNTAKDNVANQLILEALTNLYPCPE